MKYPWLLPTLIAMAAMTACERAAQEETITDDVVDVDVISSDCPEVDAAGNIYGAEVGPRAIMKYTRK